MGAIRAFTKELFRRKVVRLVGAYIAVFWLFAVGLASLLPTLGAQPWIFRAFVVVGIAAIPVLAFFSWKYDIRTGPSSASISPNRHRRSWANSTWR